MRRLSGSLSLGARVARALGAPHGAAVDRSPARPAGGLRSGLRRLDASSRARRGGRRARRTATGARPLYSLFLHKERATLITLVTRRRHVRVFVCERCTERSSKRVQFDRCSSASHTHSDERMEQLLRAKRGNVPGLWDSHQLLIN